VGYFNAINTSATGLTAQRVRMDTIAQNIANVSTTRSEDGLPYRRKTVVFEERNGVASFKDVLDKKMNGNFIGDGVRVVSIVEDENPFREVYDPGHPDANEEGYVLMPNVDTVTEMVNMISSTRSYEANVTALNSSKSMAMKALEIGK
jgi:flagellar basal-body rod protein FlgC